jgi:hypothetical protein
MSNFNFVGGNGFLLCLVSTYNFFFRQTIPLKFTCLGLIKKYRNFHFEDLMDCQKSHRI